MNFKVRVKSADCFIEAIVFNYGKGKSDFNYCLIGWWDLVLFCCEIFVFNLVLFRFLCAASTKSLSVGRY